jgi:predicted NUDIX family NTP pyrophosphohydrolase
MRAFSGVLKTHSLRKDMAKQSAGLLLYRKKRGITEVLLVHPGGPFWKNKDDGSWSIPKGEFEDDEEPLEAAKREFQEETGFAASGEFLALLPVRQPSGKVIHVWALHSDLDAEATRSNSFSMEWPRGSGRMAQFPEVDRAAWFPITAARRKMLKGQLPFLDQLQKLI